VYGNGRLDVRAAVELALVTISPTSVNVPAAGGAGSIEVVTAPGTSPSWRVVSSNPSVVITSAASGTGSGTVSFQVRENQDETPRVLTFRVARRTFTVFQEAAKHCTYLLSPTSRSFPAAGGSASFDVVTQADCPWSVSSNADWVMINSAASGSGPGTVNFTVAAGTGSKRKTKLPVLNAGKFVIKQRAN
ncbi:MAG TPA: BACON domain-containing protein, partial [Blastocatellia bacterium]|nr:BACON domain-containing protein [Blastocatellia bacterium]